ncbi:MAG: hypothetical protein ACI8QZ_000210 [Chlamydiales bacterium]|jgi:hypothetical protein
MDTKQIDVVCPCCSTVLAIDVRTASVLRTSPPREVGDTGKAELDGARWDVATERTANRTETSKSEFDGAMEKERSRESDLDALFEKARQKARKRAEGEGEDPF